MKHDCFLKLLNLPEKYEYLKISNSGEWGGAKNPFKLWAIDHEEKIIIYNDIYTENLIFTGKSTIQVENCKLQIQNEIIAKPKVSLNFIKIKKHEEACWYKDLDNEALATDSSIIIIKKSCNLNPITDIEKKFGSKKNPYHKIFIEENIKIILNQEIFVKKLIIGSNSTIKLCNCKLSVTEQICAATYENTSDVETIGAEANIEALNE